MIAGSLTIDLNANIARLAGEMRQANNMIGGFAQQAERALAGVTRAFGALGIGIGVGAFVAGIKSMVDAAAKLDDISERTGAAVEQLSKLEQVARIGGHSMEAAEMALIRLSKALHGADEESKGAGKALAALGLSADALRGKDTAEALKIVAVELNKYADGSGKTALALDLLGKSGAQALPFLKDLATEQGISVRVTAEQAAKAEELQKTLARLRNEVHGVGQALLMGLSPFLLNLIEQMKEATTIAGGLGSALLLMARTNALKDFGLDLKGTREQLAGFEADRARILRVTRGPVDTSGIDLAIADANKRIELLKLQQRQQALALGGADTRGEAQRFGLGGQQLGLNYTGAANAAAAKSVAEVESAYKAMHKTLSEMLLTERDRTEVNKLQLALDAMTAKKRAEFKPGEEDALKALAAKVDLNKQEVAFQELLLAGAKKREEVQATDEAKFEAQHDAARKLIGDIEQETKLIGLSNDERETAIALRVLETSGIDKESEAYKDFEKNLRSVLTLKQSRQADVTRATDEAAEAKRLGDAYVSEAKRIENSLNDSITDGLMRGFEGGKDAAQNFRDTLVNMFKTLILRPVIQWVLSPVSGAISATLAGLMPGSAGASGSASGGGGSNPLNILSTGNSLYNALSGNSSGLISRAANFLGFGGGGAASSAVGLSAAAGIGSAATLGFGATGLGLAAPTALSGLGFGVGGAGLGLSAAGVNAAAIGTGAAGAGAIGAGLATAIPYVGAALAIAGMLGLFGGSGKTSAVGTGRNFYGDYSAGSDVLTLQDQGLTNKGSEPAVNITRANTEYLPLFAMVSNATEQIGDVARSLGLVLPSEKISYSASGNLYGPKPDDFQRITAAITEQLVLKMAPALKQYSQENESLLNTFLRLASQVEVVDKILEITGHTIEVSGFAAIEFKDDLIKLMGGLQSAIALTESYYTNFFTSTERFTIDLGRVNTALTELGLTTLPTTRAEFRLLVEAQDLNTRAGKEMFSALMQLAPAFAAVTQVMQETSAAAAQITLAQSGALKAVQDQISATNSSANAARQAAENYRGLTETLLDAAKRIRGGGRGQFGADLASLFGAAMTGDAAALAGLPQAAEDFLSASRLTAKSSLDLARDQAKAALMLEQAAGASSGMANWNEYQAGLLQTQVTVLEAIKAQLELPQPDVEILREQTAVLGAIAGLLRDQSTLTGAQTQQIITGNTTQDVIRTLSARDTTLSEAMLTELVSSAVIETSQFAGMLVGVNTTAALLRQLVNLQTVQSAAELAAAQARAAAAIAAAEASAAAAIAAAQASAAAALASVAAAAQTAALDTAFQGYRFTQTQQSGADAIAGSPAIQQWLTSLGITQQNGGTQFLNTIGDLITLNTIGDMLKSATGHAAGGIASGLSWVGERGPELADFATPTRIYSAADSRAMMGGDTERLEALVETLIAKVEALERPANETARNTGSLERTTTQVTRGGQYYVTIDHAEEAFT